MKNKESLQYIGNLLTLRELISNLESLKKDLGNTLYSDTIKLAIEQIGICQDCRGTGEEITGDKPDTNYKITKSPKGLTLYVVHCTRCDGSGKQLDVLCCSCGESKAIRPGQRYLEYCHTCEKRLTLTGVLIF